MKLEHLRTFVTAAEHLNFTQAARLLYLSQSAVSQQIRELEDGLGVQLFERRGRGLMLTSAGALLSARAGDLLRDVRRIERELEQHVGEAQGVLRVGASNIPGLYLLPRAIGQFVAAAPSVRVTLTIHPHEELLNLMHAGELDVVVTQEDPPAARLHGWDKAALLGDELIMIAGPGHPLAGEPSVAVGRLPAHGFIMRQRGSVTDGLVLERLAEAGLAPDAIGPRFELAHPEGIKQAVMAGLGLGFVSRSAVQVELAAGRLREVPIDGVRIVRTHWLLQPQLAPMPAHFAAFLGLLHEPGWRPAWLAAS